MWSALCVALLPIVAVSLAGAATLEQHPRELTVQEGKAVTFQCSIKEDSMRNYLMSWYRQGPRGTQEWIYTEGGSYGEGFRDRFKIRDERFKNKFPLQILAAKQGDSATYYCRASVTLRSEGIGNLRLEATGPGTTLTVEPKVEKTTKSEDGSIGKTTPLPTIFHTKNLEDIYEQNRSSLITQMPCTDKFDSSMITILPDPEGQRVNMLSMAVLGLRVLLAKSIAFNTLLSIKLFLF